MTPFRLTALAACVVLLAIVAAGCGEKEPGIPANHADAIIRLLRQAREQADDPDKCDDLQATIRSIRVRVKRLPDDVDGDVRDSLENGVSNLADSAEEQCSETKPKKPRTTPTTETETVPTETVPTTPTETTPTETTPTETTPTTPTQPTTPTEPPPDTGGTPGNGNGNGQPPKDLGGAQGKKRKGKDKHKAGRGKGHERGKRD